MKVTITVDDAGSAAGAVQLSTEPTPEGSTVQSSGGISAGPAPADPGAPSGVNVATGAEVGAFDPARAAGDAISAGPAPSEE
jgi:hypothetical protein